MYFNIYQTYHPYKNWDLFFPPYLSVSPILATIMRYFKQNGFIKINGSSSSKLRIWQRLWLGSPLAVAPQGRHNGQSTNERNNSNCWRGNKERLGIKTMSKNVCGPLQSPLLGVSPPSILLYTPNFKHMKLGAEAHNIQTTNLQTLVCSSHLEGLSLWINHLSSTQ